MLTLKKIAVTGGTASGKTSVCQFFRELGAFVVDTDAIAHRLLESDFNLQRQLIQQFGSEIVEGKKISRKILARKVFENQNSLKTLERFMHPLIFSKVKKLYHKAASLNQYTSFVVEMPLLFETDQAPFYDFTITVTTDELLAKERFESQGFLSEDYALRMKRQLSPQEKEKRADYVIHNNGSLQELKQTVIGLNKKIQQESKKS